MKIKIGDNNKIKNINNTENYNVKIEEKHTDGFWKQVFVNIMSNLLWKILGILFSVGIFVALCMLANGH